jgi:hypothetical protein
MPVDTRMLRVDSDISFVSPKGYSPADLDQIATTIPKVYDALGRGVPPARLMDAAAIADPRKQAIGKTYAHVFGMSGTSQVLAADLDGGELHVVKGNHRIRAAQRMNVPFVPVEVHARSAADLDRLETGLRAQHGPAYENLQAVHRNVDLERATGRTHGAVRDPRPASRTPARRPGMT